MRPKQIVFFTVNFDFGHIRPRPRSASTRSLGSNPNLMYPDAQLIKFFCYLRRIRRIMFFTCRLKWGPRWRVSLTKHRS
jgi:hypothetical protein